MGNREETAKYHTCQDADTYVTLIIIFDSTNKIWSFELSNITYKYLEIGLVHVMTELSKQLKT